MTEAIYLEVLNKHEELRGKRRVSISGMLSILGVSRSGYNSWLHRLPSGRQKRKKAVSYYYKGF